MFYLYSILICRITNFIKKSILVPVYNFQYSFVVKKMAHISLGTILLLLPWLWFSTVGQCH